MKSNESPLKNPENWLLVFVWACAMGAAFLTGMLAGDRLPHAPPSCTCRCER